MKGVLTFIMAATFVISWPAHANPKIQHYIQAATTFAGALTSYTTGITLLNTPEITMLTKVQAASAFVAGTGQVAIAGLSMASAEGLEEEGTIGGGEGIGAGDIPSFEGGADFSSGRGIAGSDSGLRNRALDLKNEAIAKQNDLQQKLDSLLGPDGIEISDLANSPGKYLTPDEMSELSKTHEEPKNKEHSEDDPTTDSFLTAGFGNQGGVFVPSSGLFNLDDLLSSQLRGMNLSAPGYYGNVQLKVLGPNSKKSLFERVSLKLKDIWKEAPLHDILKRKRGIIG